MTLKARLYAASPPSVQTARNRAARFLNASVWFPHVPLAILVGATGLLQIRQGVESERAHGCRGRRYPQHGPRRAHAPDVLLTLPQLGGELLAMALSGEEIRTDALISQLLKLG